MNFFGGMERVGVFGKREVKKKNILHISCGTKHTIAVCNDGVYAWGKNEYGQLCLDHRNDVFYSTYQFFHHC